MHTKPQKNVKIDEDIHTELSVKAARLHVKKSVLAGALITAALTLPPEVLARHIDHATINNPDQKRSKKKTV